MGRKTLQRCLQDTFVSLVEDLVFVVDRTGTIVAYKEDVDHKTLYFDKEEIIGRNINEIGFEEPYSTYVVDGVRKVFSDKENIKIPYWLELPERGRCFFEASLGFFDKNRVVVVVREKTNEVVYESRQKLAVDILGILNVVRIGSPKNIVRDILHKIKNNIGVDAIGIRLKRGNDYPYYVTIGFEDSFVKEEDSLFSNVGVRGMECLCGKVVTGRYSEELSSYFTKNGSFWTNDFRAFIEEFEYKKCFRKTCGIYGYDGVALIPLKTNGDVLGLLQLNNGSGCFGLRDIEFLEGIGASVVIGVLRKEAEESLRSSLEEKEILLKEVHHRVKNILQVIQSMFKVQEDYVESEESKEVLQVSGHRIRLMALVYSELYQTDNFSTIRSSKYIQNVVNNLFTAYNIKPNQIRLDFVIEQADIDIRRAVSCGLLINELVSNVFKHAFPYSLKRIGNLFVSWKLINGDIELVVKDDGVGISQDSLHFAESGTFGLYLVGILVKQLEGEMSVESQEGTCFRIVFPRNVKEEEDEY